MEPFQDDYEVGESKHVIIKLTTDTPTTLSRGEITTTLDIFLAALEASLDEDEGDELKHVIDDSTTDTPTTLDLRFNVVGVSVD